MADLSNYTLMGGTLAAPVTAASLGIADIALHFMSRAVDTASFVIPVASAASDPIFPFGSTVSIRQDGTQIFLGTIQEAPAEVISGTSEAHSYRVVGPWWHLENTVYQQSWAFKTASGLTLEPSSHITLFQSIEGERISNAAQILDALNWAIGAGAPLQIGTIFGAAVYPPTRDEKDLMVAEAIKQAVRWTPDVSSRIDYSTTPPTIHFLRRADLTPVTLSVGGDIVSDTLQITPRHDLQVPSVTLKFEQTHTDDQNTWGSLVVDTYPVGSSEQAVKAIVQTLELSGSSTTRQKQAIVTRSLPSAPTDPTAIIDWFRRVTPWLSKIPTDKLELMTGSFYSFVEPGQKMMDGVTDIPADWDADDYPRELVAGSIADWMTFPPLSLHAARVTLGVVLRFTGFMGEFADGSYGDATMGAKLKDAFSLNVDPSAPNYNTLWLQGGLLATNAETGTYSQITNSTSAEDVPTGLSQGLYEALGTLYHDVHFRLVEQDITRCIGLGNALNLTGDRAEYETMFAPVQEITWSLADGVTTAKCGVPEHLAPADIIEYLRGLRQSVSVANPAARTTGVASSLSTVSGSGFAASTTSQVPPGGGGTAPIWTDFAVLDASDSNGTKAKVFKYSTLWTAYGTKMPISGLDTPHSLAIGDYIYAAIKIKAQNDVSVDSAEVRWGSVWDGGPSNPIGSTPDSNGYPYQTYYYHLIAEVTDPETEERPGIEIGKPGARVQIVQHANAALLCKIDVVSGIPILTPYPCTL